MVHMKCLAHAIGLCYQTAYAFSRARILEVVVFCLPSWQATSQKAKLRRACRSLRTHTISSQASVPHLRDRALKQANKKNKIQHSLITSTVTKKPCRWCSSGDCRTPFLDPTEGTRDPSERDSEDVKPRK